MASLQGVPSPDGQCPHCVRIRPARLHWLHDLLSLWTQLNATCLFPNLSLPRCSSCQSPSQGWSYPITPDSSLPADVSKLFNTSGVIIRPWLSISTSNYPRTNLPTLSQPINCHQDNHTRLHPPSPAPTCAQHSCSKTSSDSSSPWSQNLELVFKVHNKLEPSHPSH